MSKKAPLSSVANVCRLIAPYRVRIALALGALLVGSSINLLFPEVIRRALHPETFPVVLENLGLLFGLCSPRRSVLCEVSALWTSRPTGVRGCS